MNLLTLFLRFPSSTVILVGVGGLRFCKCRRREDTTSVVIGSRAGLTGEVVSLGSNLDGVDCLILLITLGVLSATSLGDSSNKTDESLLLARDGLEGLASCKSLLGRGSFVPGKEGVLCLNKLGDRVLTAVLLSL